MNISFKLRNISKKSQIGKIYVYIDFYTTTHRRQIFIATPVKIESYYWNSKTQKLNKFHPSFEELTKTLEIEKNKVWNIINKFELSGIEITPESIQDYIGIKKEGTKDLITLGREYIMIRTDAKPKNIEKLNNLLVRLEDFTNGKKVYYSNFNQKFINDFIEYLQTEKPKHTNKQLIKSQQPSTIHKTFSFLRQILNYYNSTGLIDDKYKNFKYPKGFKQKQMVLQEDEIKILLAFKPIISRLEKVKDLALLQLFTGLRYSDAVKLNKSNIYNNYINLNTKKTNQDLTIPLHSNLKKLIEKYNYDLSVLNISNVNYNKYLKELIELVGITSKSEYKYFVNGQMVTTQKYKYEMIASHTFRRSFITNAIIQGIPIHIIQSITGHTTLKQLSEYVTIADEIKTQQMSKLDNLFKIG